MTQTLECPKCGAPLKFDPHPGEETVECPYCHETVVIPEDLRIPLPKPAIQYLPPATRSMPKIWLWISIIGVLITGGFILANSLSSSNQSSDNGNSGANDVTPTFSDGVNVTVTAEAKATTEALKPVLLQMQSGLPEISDEFSDNSHQWTTGDVRDSYANGNRSIANGIYSWKITAVQSSILYSYPEMTAQQDFYASVDMKFDRMPDDPEADAGLFFRLNSTDQSWYYFSVNAQGLYYFGWFDGTDWYTLIPQTATDAYHQGQTNQLAVGARGSQFIFLINHQVVDHFVDNNLKSGVVGLAVNLPKEGENAAVEYAHFSVLQAPQGQ